jgi:predicted RNA polymerase sigma factor
MTTTEDRLRTLSPQVLGVLARRIGNFAEAEDAVQEALLAASTSWPTDGVPDDPAAWLQRAAFRRFVDAYRSDQARRRRELIVASWSLAPPPAVETTDDTLTCMYLCCHPVLSPSLAIPLTLRAVGGLTTEQIAAAFLVPVPTMGQRISRAKAKLKAEDAPFATPPADELAHRLRSVLHVLYLIFNEGYAATAGEELARAALTDRAIALTRIVQAAHPDDAEVAGLLALMLLTDARRPARTTEAGDVVALAEQDRTRWDRAMITEGLGILTVAMRRGPLGDYGLQACIAALHNEATSAGATRWAEIAALYERLEQLTGNPMVRLNRALAVGMAGTPQAGLVLLDGIDGALAGHQRMHAARAHLLELAGRTSDAADHYRLAAARATNTRERDHLVLRAARLGSARARPG